MTPGRRPERGTRTIIDVHVQPRSQRTEAVGLHGDAVKIRVAAPPVNGAANAELTRFLSATLGVPRAAVVVVGGAHGRRKRIEISGIDRATVLHRLGRSNAR